MYYELLLLVKEDGERERGLSGWDPGWGLVNPFPGHICVCVVNRNGGGDAVIAGLDFH